MALHRNPSRDFEAKIRRITAVGVEVPADLDDLEQRLRGFMRDPAGTDVFDDLARAVINGDDTGTLWVLALATANTGPGVRGEVIDAIRARVNTERRRRYTMRAIDIYAAVAEKFDTAAKALTAAVGVVEPELPADALLDRPAKEQRAWQDAGTQRAALDGLLPALAAAAELANITTNAPDDQLPLAVDTEGLHRRRLWEAWDADDTERRTIANATANQGLTGVTPPAPTRTGRWGKLLALGATIRAHNPAHDFHPYRRPKPLIERTVVENGVTRRIVTDPEDHDHTEPEPATTPPPARVTIRG